MPHIVIALVVYSNKGALGRDETLGSRAQRPPASGPGMQKGPEPSRQNWVSRCSHPVPKAAFGLLATSRSTRYHFGLATFSRTRGDGGDAP